MNLKKKPHRKSSIKGLLALLFMGGALTLGQAAQAADKTLTGITITPTGTNISPVTSGPGEEVVRQFTISAPKPAGQTATNVPNAGFKFPAHIVLNLRCATSSSVIPAKAGIQCVARLFGFPPSRE